MLDVVALGIGDGVQLARLVRREERLSRPRKARAHGEKRALLVGVVGHVASHLGARPDERHLAPDDVDELWELIELGRAQDGADPGHTRIPTAAHRRSHPVRSGDHGAELEDAEGTSVLTHPLLPEERRAAALELHRGGEQEDHGRGAREREPPEDHVHAAPKRGVPAHGVGARARALGKGDAHSISLRIMKGSTAARPATLPQ